MRGGIRREVSRYIFILVRGLSTRQNVVKKVSLKQVWYLNLRRLSGCGWTTCAVLRKGYYRSEEAEDYQRVSFNVLIYPSLLVALVDFFLRVNGKEHREHKGRTNTCRPIWPLRDYLW